MHYKGLNDLKQAMKAKWLLRIYVETNIDLSELEHAKIFSYCKLLQNKYSKRN